MPRFTRELKSGPAVYQIATPTRDFLPIFSIPALAEQAVLQLGRAARDKNAAVIGYCLTPSKLQAIIGFKDTHDLGSFLYHYKWLVSHAIICVEHGEYHDRLYRKGKFKPWMNRFDNVILSSTAQIEARLAYIHDEPVKKGLAKSATEWLYSSAADWQGARQGIIEIIRDFSAMFPNII